MTHIDVIKKTDVDGTTVTETVHHETSSDYVAIRRVIFYLLDLVLIVLVTRFILRALGASSSGSFVNFIYSISWPLVAPFQGVAAPVFVEGGVFEWTSLVAITVYTLIAYVIIRLFRILAANNK